MVSSTTITRQDLKSAILKGCRFYDLERGVLKQLKLPAPEKTSSSPLFFARKICPELEPVLLQWMKGRHPERDLHTRKSQSIILAPFSPGGISVSSYLQPVIKKYKPKAIALDASFALIGAALHYAFSLLYALKIPVRVGLVYNNDTLYEEVRLKAGDFIPELAAFCYRKRIPLIPLFTRAVPVPSQHQYVYNQFIESAQSSFAQEANKGLDINVLQKTAAESMNKVFMAGLDLGLERESLINESCYLASRLFDLWCYKGLKTSLISPLLVLYNLPHVLDFPGLVKVFSGKNAPIDELYQPPESQPDGMFKIAPFDESEEDTGMASSGSLLIELERRIDRVLIGRMNEKISLDEADHLSAAVAEATRSHPLIERPGGVRGTIAVREIVQAYGLLRGVITRKALAESSFLALAHRNHLKPGEDSTIEEVLKGIISRVIYSIPLEPVEEHHASEKSRPMTSEEIAKALRGLTDVASRELEPGEALPIDNPAFAEQVMNHPLVQQALKDAMERGLSQNMQESYRELLKELEERGDLELFNSSEVTLSEQGRQRLRKSLEEALAMGDISKEDLANALKNARALPLPPGVEGEKFFMQQNALTEFIAEIMDMQHQGRSQSTSLEDLYVHYALKENKGLEISPEKIDYEKLKIMIDNLERKGLVKLTGHGKRFVLSSLSLERLLEGLIRRQESQMLEKRAFRKEHESDKTDVRRYQNGDVFRDISVRHTLRSIVRKGKSLEDINYSDFRSFEKKPTNQLDIAVCVDVSASMKDNAKLRYAKMAVAELARAAIDKHDRIGIVSFSNLGQVVVPLTDKISPILEAVMTMRPEQYTNIGNGLLCARRMLLKQKNSNPKYIVLITDGQPNAALSDDYEPASYGHRVAAYSRETTMERREVLGSEHALVEASKTSRQNIKISVVFISQRGDEQGEKLARSIAKIGQGRFHKVLAVERLPLEALATVG